MDAGQIITISVLGLACVVNVLLGCVVLFQNPREWLNKSFFLFTLSAAFWVLTNLLYAIITDVTLRLDTALFSYAAAGFLALFFMFYCLSLAHVTVKRWLLVVIWTVGLLITLGSTIPGFVANSVTFNGRIVTNALPLAVYGGYLLVFMGTGITALIRGRQHMHGSQKQRMVIVLLGLIFAALFGLSLNLILPMFGNYNFVAIGPVASLILAGSSTYAIIRHQLFDIRFAAVRSLAYASSLFTLAVIYYVIAYVASVVIFRGQSTTEFSVNPVNVSLALVLAFIFQPLKRFFDKVTNDIFYRNNYSSETFFTELGTILTSTTDLHGLLESTAGEIARTFKAEQVFFRLSYTNSTEHHVSAGTRHHSNMPVYDVHMLDTYVATAHNKVFVTEFMSETDEAVRRMLRSHKVALVVTLTKGEENIGYLLLGDHLSGNYTKRDLKTLTAMRNELVIAIQNALSLHEVQELNATLQQRIDVATKELRSSNAQLKHLDEVKDEFMSMASHQLRTPLTSVKGYISMVLEGDAGKITPQQHKLLIEAFKSSERMVGLIADFLNVSRLQTGRFVIEKVPFDLREIVQQEVNDLQLIATSHDIKLRAKLATGAFPVNADEQKLRQVIMNFIDNAVYYSHPNSTIIINLEKVAGAAALTVVDTGIGVPENEQSHLFNKFFRAKNARKQRPDGTGVGLYLARRVVTAHGGSMIFSSKEGKGSTFGFRLPLEKPESSEARQ